MMILTVITNFNDDFDIYRISSKAYARTCRVPSAKLLAVFVLPSGPCLYTSVVRAYELLVTDCPFLFPNMYTDSV